MVMKDDRVTQFKLRRLCMHHVPTCSTQCLSWTTVIMRSNLYLSVYFIWHHWHYIHNRHTTQ